MALDPEDRKIANELADGGKALVIGDSVVYPPLAVNGRHFHFDPFQIRFLYALQKEKGNIERATEFCGKPMEWGKKFITSRKFREFRNAKLASASVRNGDLVEWWWKMGLEGAKGTREWWEAECLICHEVNVYEVAEIEMYRQDDMALAAKCKVCLQDVTATFHTEKVQPSREQVQFWGELGNRLVPKIERVHHEFSKENFVFETQEDPA